MRSDPTASPTRFRKTLLSRLEAFDGLVRNLTDWSVQAGVPADTLRDVVLILDELFSNIVIHGYHHASDREILVEAEVHSQQVDVTLTDHAPAFNPLLAPEPDTRLPLEERPIGGLGLLFVRRTADRLQYWRVESGTDAATNKIQFTKWYGPTLRPSTPG